MRVIGKYVKGLPYCIKHAEEDDSEIPITTQDEVDVPIHCMECEKLLHVRLTDAGYEYIANRIIVYVESNGEIGRGEILREWHEQYGHSVDLDYEYIEALEDLTLDYEDPLPPQG